VSKVDYLSYPHPIPPPDLTLGVSRRPWRRL
jgi:hypothetical protein